MSPLVTIIIPCYQHGHLLAEAVDSALAQTRRDLEVIIIDDGSTDVTLAVADGFVRRYPAVVNYFYQENQGQHEARQRGLEAANGRFCLTLDADDLLEPDAVERCLAAFEAHPEADAVVGDALVVGPDGRKVLRPHTQETIAVWPEVLGRNPYGVNLGVMTRTGALRAAGGLGLAPPGCEDWDVWCRMTRCGMRFVRVAAVLGRYRQTGQNHSRNVAENLRAYVGMLDRAAADDPRLAGAGHDVAPPINPELYHLYRNGRVCYALGLALGLGLGEGEWAAIADQLTSGRLEPAWCVGQFTEGLAFGWQQQAAETPEVPLGRALAVFGERMERQEQRTMLGELRAGMIHAVRQVTGRRSWLYLAQRLREKVLG